MHLQATEAVNLHRAADHCRRAASVACRVDGGEADQLRLVAADDTREAGVRGGVVAVEDGKDHRSRDAGSTRPCQMRLNAGLSVPGAPEAVACTSVAVTIDDHHCIRASATDPRY